MMKPNKICVFVPAFNEEENIRVTLRELKEWMPNSSLSSAGHQIELLVIDDGSTDRTLELCREASVIVVSHLKNEGLGAATRTGIKEALRRGADIAIKFDCDQQYQASEIDEVVKPILNGEVDLCWGSRFAGSISYSMPLVRKVGNRFFTWLMNRLTGFVITDAQSGMMAFHRRYLQISNIIGNYNPPQQILLDAYKKGMHFGEVPIHFHRRDLGRSFVSWRYPFYVVINLLRFYLQMTRRDGTNLK